MPRREAITNAAHVAAQAVANHCGIGCWMTEILRVVTPEELAQIDATWLTMPGHTSRVDAALLWLRKQS